MEVEKRRAPESEKKISEKRQKVAKQKKKDRDQGADSEDDSPVPVSTRKQPSAEDLSAVKISRSIESSIRTLKAELKAELRQELKAESKAGLQAAKESSKHFEVLTTKFQQEMVNLFKEREEKLSAQLKVLIEHKAIQEQPEPQVVLRADCPTSQVKKKSKKSKKSAKATRQPPTESDNSATEAEAPRTLPNPPSEPADTIRGSENRSVVPTEKTYLERIIQLQEQLIQQQTSPQKPEAHSAFPTPFQVFPYTHFGQPQLVPALSGSIQPGFTSPVPQLAPAPVPQYAFLPDSSASARMVGGEPKQQSHVQALLSALQKSLYQ